MLTEQMLDHAGQPRDVYASFGRNPATLSKLSKNLFGLAHTAQASATGYAIEKAAPPWQDFEDVWIPVSDNLRLSGRLGFARSAGVTTKADCIILLPGLWGDNGVVRTRDLAEGLRTIGFHVLALEVRGHGQTERRYPDTYYNFGVLETQDLLKVSEWLQDSFPQVRETGLIGFCWGGNLALLAAWFDNRSDKDPSISENIARVLDPVSPRRHFAAGIITFSPVLRWEEIMEQADVDATMKTPIMYFFQDTIRDRMVRKGYPEVCRSLRRLINYEFAWSGVMGSLPIEEGYRFLRLMPHRGQSAGDKLQRARMPVLIVTGANDPFLSAQDLADLIARTSNPNLAGEILRGGGHIGFIPYNQAYTYSLIVNFFDPRVGAAAMSARHN